MFQCSVFLSFCLVLTACSSNTDFRILSPEKNAIDTIIPQNKMITTPLYSGLSNFESLQVAGHWVDIALPDSTIPYMGNIVVLPGYNYSRKHWCEQGHAPQLCSLAKAKGFVLIMPEMGRSVYAQEFFAETADIFRSYPLRSWLSDELFLYLQKHHSLLLPQQKNYLLGLSTGARGAALLALDLPHLFRACAVLSGDFDQSKMKDDKLMTLFYGPYSPRWDTVDNVLHRIKEWKLPVYLGHGQRDKVVPPEQTRLFYEALLLHFDSNKIKLHEPLTQAHDYRYWGSETEAVLEFFARDDR